MAHESSASEWCVVDLETTGFFASAHDRIVEIALVLVGRDGSVSEEWHTLVNPGRDLGPTHIHGITADLTAQAPTFAEVAGDVLHFMRGRRLAAHNAAFDLRFLHAEFQRAGLGAVRLNSLCTMAVASRLGIGRKLDTCCTALEIENAAPHTALGDARATAELLSYLLKLRELGRGCNRTLPDPIPAEISVALAPSGRCVPRKVAADRATPKPYMARLAGRLPTPSAPAGASPEAVVAYSELLDTALEDRVVVAEEIDALAAVARQWQLDRAQVDEINLAYFGGLVSVALADGVITEAERRDLERTASLLGVGKSTFETLLTGGMPRQASIVPGDGSEFDGMSVCFTGSSCCTIRGERLTRDFAITVAVSAGLRVEKGVTKRLDILVVADPGTRSGKAKKARLYGTRIVAERSFWPRLGISVD